MIVQEYVREDGSSPFRLWFDDSRHPGQCQGGDGDCQDGDELIILFVGGTKKRQQADIDRASVLLTEYKSRKAAAKKAKG